MFSHIFLHFSPPRAGAKILPAKFLVGSRRPARSARPPAHRISSQNVSSAHNYGIVKAGDGGNGGRSWDGDGGTDSTTLSGSLTNGKKGGSQQSNAGAAGDIYSYGTKGIDPNNTNALQSSEGKAGQRGNDGWAGINLYGYTFKKHKDNNWSFAWDKKSPTLFLRERSKDDPDNDADDGGVFIRNQFTNRENYSPTHTDAFYVLMRAGKKWGQGTNAYFMTPDTEDDRPGIHLYAEYKKNDSYFINNTYTGEINRGGHNYYYKIYCEKYQYDRGAYAIKNMEVYVWARPDGEFISANVYAYPL